MSSTASNPVEVFVFKAGKFLGSRCFQQETILVGSGASATLRLRDPVIADHQATLHVRGASVLIADEAGGNQVLVNGEPVQTREVHSFDEVRVGPFRLKVTLLGDQAAEDPGFGDAPAAPAASAAVVQRNQSAQGTPATVEDARPAVPPSPHVPLRSSGKNPFASLNAKAGDRPQSRHTAGLFDGLADADAPHESAGDQDFDDFDDTATAQIPAANVAPPDAAPSPSPASPVYAASDDDDDDDEGPFVEPFSLLENIVRDRFKDTGGPGSRAVVEVIRYRQGDVLDLIRAEPGKSVRLPQDKYLLTKATGDGLAELYFQPDFSGTVVRGGQAQPIEQLAAPDNLISARKKRYGVQLREGDYAQIVRPDAGYLVRFIRPPSVPEGGSPFRLDPRNLRVFAGSAVFHLVLLATLGFITPEQELPVDAESERFAKVAIKDLQLEKPKEEPKKEEPPPPEPPPEAPPEPAPEPKRQRRPKKPRRQVDKKAQQQQAQQAKAKARQQKQVGDVLTALQNVAPSAPRSNLKSLVTNIKAVRGPSTNSRFKIAGTIGKIAGGGVRLAGTGNSGKDTKVGSQLLAGGKVGGMKALAGTGTRVRGKARRAPTRAIGTTGGFLSREAIQKVVAANMARIQACYERQLLSNRSLAGKVVFDWIITPTGKVSTARQASSSLGSSSVSSCILREIRTWRFPRPQGGAVNVRYPFVFRVQGF